MAGPWMFEKKYDVDCVSIPAAMWRSKATLLPYLDHLKQKGLREKSLASRADLLFFQFTDEAGNVILPDDEETMKRMSTCIPDIYDYENYTYEDFDGLLVRRSTEKIKLAEPMTALQFYKNCDALREPPPNTREGILQLFADLAIDGAVIPYKTDAYSHHKDGGILEIDDIVSPLDFVNTMFGINLNMYLISPPGTLSSFHLEELCLASINGIKIGEKVWWFLVDPDGVAGPTEMAARLESAIRKALLARGEQYAGCNNFMRAKRYAIHPNFLANENIQLITVQQSKGQFVYTGVKTYHMVLSKKCTVSSAKNLIPIRKDGEYAFVPSILNFCPGNHPSHFKEVHCSGLGRFVFSELSSGMGISGLINTYLLAVKSGAFENCRLPALTKYTGNINAITDKYEQLLEAKKHLLVVWTNITNSSNKPITGYVMHVSKEEEYAIIAPRFSPDSSLMVRSFSAIRLSADKYEYEVKKPFKLYSDICLEEVKREDMDPFHHVTIDYENGYSAPCSYDNLSYEIIEDTAIEHGDGMTMTRNRPEEDPIQPHSSPSTCHVVVGRSRQEFLDGSEREPSTQTDPDPAPSSTVSSSQNEGLTSGGVTSWDEGSARCGFQDVVDDIFAIRANARIPSPTKTSTTTITTLTTLTTPSTPTTPTTNTTHTTHTSPTAARESCDSANVIPLTGGNSQIIPRSTIPQTTSWPTSMINPRGEYPDSQKVRVHGFPEKCPYACILNTLSQYGPLVGIAVSSFRGSNIIAIYQSAVGADIAKGKSSRREIMHEGVPIIVSPYFRCQPLQRQQQQQQPLSRFGGRKRTRLDGGNSTVFNVFSGAQVHYSKQ